MSERYIVAETYTSKVIDRFDTLDAALACAKREACQGRCVGVYERRASIVPSCDVREDQ